VKSENFASTKRSGFGLALVVSKVWAYHEHHVALRDVSNLVAFGASMCLWLLMLHRATAEMQEVQATRHFSNHSEYSALQLFSTCSTCSTCRNSLQITTFYALCCLDMKLEKVIDFDYTSD
jgi:hypothetical protein